MAAYDFPPTAGEPTDGSFIYTAPTGELYSWNGYAWISAGSAVSSAFVRKTGDDMTGDLTLSTNKIELKAADGSAKFMGTVAYQNTSPNPGTIAFQIKDGSSTVFRVYADGETEIPNIAYFGGNTKCYANGNVDVGKTLQVVKNISIGGDSDQLINIRDSAKGPSYLGSTVTGKGSALFGRGNDGAEIVSAATVEGLRNIQFKTGETSASAVEITRLNATGLYVGGTLPSAPNIHLNTDGSGEFSAKVTSAETVDTDADNTLVTKSYVDANGGGGGNISLFGTAKAWGRVASNGTLLEGLNCTVSKSGTTFTVTFDTPKLTDTYCVVASANESGGTLQPSCYQITEAGFKVQTRNDSNTLVNKAFSFIVIDSEPAEVSISGSFANRIAELEAKVQTLESDDSN